MTINFETPAQTVGLTINAPEIFARDDFMSWLNNPETRCFTWHRLGQPASEYSDVVVLVDSSYEGDSSDMPDDIWRAICEATYGVYGGAELPLAKGSHVTVRLTNLAD